MAECNPNELIEQAKCFQCLDDLQRKLVIIQLLCDIEAGGGGGGGSVDVEDDGVPVVSPASVLNFTGSGVVVTDAGGGQADIAIAGGGSGVDVEDEGVPVATAAVLNFIGAGVTATDAGGGTVDVTIPGGGSSGIDVEDDGTPVLAAATTLNFTGDVAVTDSGGGVAAVALFQRVFTNAGDPNGVVTATGPAICLDTTNSIIWWKTSAGTSNNEWT